MVDFPNNRNQILSGPLLTSMWSGYLFKVLYEIIVMPISVPLTKWFKKKANADIYDYDTNYNPFKLN